MAESLPCPSWVWSNNSNAHAAKDRSWFGADYTPFKSAVGNLTDGPYPHHKGTIVDKQGKSVAYFSPEAMLFEVRLSGPPDGPQVGPTPFDPLVAYWINVRWADSEKAKWEAFRAASARDAEPGDVTPLLDEEKQWLKEHWGSEFKFLQGHGLTIHKNEDRAEGRAILRGYLSRPAVTSSDGDDDDVSRDYLA
ncbi:hypothetical protein CTA1_6179 [Colletotrichum tanaceti]|uniref:Uncharacterized protein n=1 Tax=Colletotrichum tanaceti TaxID=1306861 RepID=A0A4U6X7K4_9PEZI|nr:hypothetical protein CTA1_6179 [Colletotrichum tanaceti]